MLQGISLVELFLFSGATVRPFLSFFSSIGKVSPVVKALIDFSASTHPSVLGFIDSVEWVVPAKVPAPGAGTVGWVVRHLKSAKMSSTVTSSVVFTLFTMTTGTVTFSSHFYGGVECGPTLVSY